MGAGTKTPGWSRDRIYEDEGRCCSAARDAVAWSDLWIARLSIVPSMDVCFRSTYTHRRAVSGDICWDPLWVARCTGSGCRVCRFQHLFDIGWVNEPKQYGVESASQLSKRGTAGSKSVVFGPEGSKRNI